jgi:hypothetical protein
VRTFDPWIGSQYRSEGYRGVRLLILGEAHYSSERERSTFTIEMIRSLAQQGRFRFYSATQRLVVGGRGWLSEPERRDFWERVAFYNYIQTFPGSRPRERPTPEMWAAARAPFLATIAELDPQLVLVLGRELRRNLPELPTRLKACEVPHPSSRGFRYATWQPEVQAALNEAVNSLVAPSTNG